MRAIDPDVHSGSSSSDSEQEERPSKKSKQKGIRNFTSWAHLNITFKLSACDSPNVSTEPSDSSKDAEIIQLRNEVEILKREIKQKDIYLDMYRDKEVKAETQKQVDKLEVSYKFVRYSVFYPNNSPNI